ncbi:MAG TPA: STAS domain-containing protein [Candidatus Baltobacteraceae bacterium]|jgi:anti-anti-sigma factor|nr:STAS domain-containing protein [Candidatus Baltobacteraceae bacterium]
MKAPQGAPTHKELLIAAFIREEDPRGRILHVLGEVDLSNADEFQSAVLEVAKGAGNVIVDLTACTYMDSSGLRVLAIAHKTIDDRLRVVVPRNGSVHRIFEITGLAEQLNACENVDAALRTRE